MRAAAANISSAGAPSWSSYPSAAATPQLVVATTGNPAETTARAVAASHTFGSSKGVPGLCKDRKWLHRLRRSIVIVANPQEGKSQPALADDERIPPRIKRQHFTRGLFRRYIPPWQVSVEDLAGQRCRAFGIPCEDGTRPCAG